MKDFPECSLATVLMISKTCIPHHPDVKASGSLSDILKQQMVSFGAYLGRRYGMYVLSIGFISTHLVLKLKSKMAR